MCTNFLSPASAWAHRIGADLWWALRGIKARLRGVEDFEKFWRNRTVTEVRAGFSNARHPHRQWLLDVFCALPPFSTVLEIGCGYGPNLVALATCFPGIEAFGLDINTTAIQEGLHFIHDHNVHGVNLAPGRAENLASFCDASIDIVFSDATMLYVTPEKIEAVLLEMHRVCRLKLLFIELHAPGFSFDRKGRGRYTPDGWVRDYRKLLGRLFPTDRIEISKIPPSVWPAGRWGRLGHLILVSLATKAGNSEGK